MSYEIKKPREEVMESVRGSLINDTNKDTNFSFYTYNDIPVPRVTEILRKTINKEYLLYWAANVGTKSMMDTRRKSTGIGTRVHHKIEYFLANKADDVSNGFDLNLDFDSIRSIDIAYNNFKLWYNNLTNNGYNLIPLYSELKVSCPYYGGTIDLIAQINGATYIIDWKTSKSISLEYYLQTAAYMWLINNGYCQQVPHVDGIGIVRLDKSESKYEDSFLTYNNPVHCKFIDDYIATFGSLLQSYYNLVHVENFKHKYSLLDTMED